MKLNEHMEEMAEMETKPIRPPSLFREVGYLLGKLFLILGIVSLLLIFIFGVTRNTELSMAPNIQHGDLILFYRLDPHYIASDVVVLTYEDQIQTRRVVAAAGDTVDITSAGLLINGGLQPDVYSHGETLAFSEGISFPITLTEGEVFLLGDDRESAIDSRLYGPVNVRDIKGKLVLLLRRREF